jgi:hypothetical protein
MMRCSSACLSRVENPAIPKRHLPRIPQGDGTRAGSTLQVLPGQDVLLTTCCMLPCPFMKPLFALDQGAGKVLGINEGIHVLK